MSPASTNKVTLLRDRAACLAKARSFFAERGVVEVDVPLLRATAPVDVHIDLVTGVCLGKPAFLHSSPEYGMKRLLAEGIGDIYQLGHVFRDEERGERHLPEFLMAEWYRIGFTLEAMMEETVAFARLFLPQSPAHYTVWGYRDAFEHYVGTWPESLDERDWLFATEVEPHLGQEGFCVISRFPPEQAALATLSPEGWANRFEVFYQGMELANGYHELCEPLEQKERLLAANTQRVQRGKSPYPIDSRFLSALEKGMPSCCGVAVGCDRLFLLRHGASAIDAVVPFGWEEA